MPNSVLKKYTLTVGENSYSSPAAVNENDARKLQSLIPSLAGYLERERPALPFTNDAAFPSRVGFFHQFGRNDNGVITRHYFCATATTLYKLQNPGPSQVWVAVAAVGTLAAFPVAVNINNQMHLSDTSRNWIFDGANWVKDGLEIPLVAPSISAITPVGLTIAVNGAIRNNGVSTITTTAVHNLFAGQNASIAATDASFNGIIVILAVTSSTSFTYTQPGLPDVVSSGGSVNGSGFTIVSNRYYWTTYGDQSATHPHESSSSPISLGTGPQTNKQIKVFVQPGTVTTNIGSPLVSGVSTNFKAQDIGKALYTDSNLSLPVGVIASVQDSQHLTLVLNAQFTYTAVPYNIAPTRATHWYLYASSSEEDKLGDLLAVIPVQFFYYLDLSPMIGTAGSYFQNVQRPLLNDPTHATRIMEVSKNRIWRVLPDFPNFFSYTAYEEVLAEQAGTPSECVPGADPNTVSPSQVNETSYPDQSVSITGIRKHGDALYIGSESNVIPLYGDSLANFSLSEAQAFAVGFAGRKASVSTPFGLAFVSYDLKVYLYPSQYSFGVDSTTALVELGRPKRPEFELIDGADYENIDLKFYNWGRRNWLVLSYRRVDQSFGAWVFDFETKGWFQLQQGYTALAVFEMTKGRKTLIGAGTDNRVYVIDDLTGNFPVPGGTNYPVGYLRWLLDFSDPNSSFIIQSISYESSDATMSVDVTLWLDPADPENPGTGIPILMSETVLGVNSLMGRPNSDSGASCQRVLIEFAVAASAVNARFHGFTVEAAKIPNPVL